MVKWTQDLADAVRALANDYTPGPHKELDADVRSRAQEYASIQPGYELLPHQVSYTHCLLQRLDTYKERDSHAAFKRAWHEATTQA